MTSMTSPITALIILESLGLRLISRDGGVMGLSLVFVLVGLILGLLIDILFVFFCQRAMAF